MRLRTFNAPTMAQAMGLLRRELGEDAIIVSTETTPEGARIVAALEEPAAVAADPFGLEAPEPEAPEEDPIDAVHEALLAHGLPNPLLEKLVDASFLAGTDEPIEALAGALARIFAFQPLIEHGAHQPIMLVGMPGAGKTVTIAKLAARAVLANRKVRLITTDTVRAGAVEQLSAFAKVLSLPCATAETDRELALQASRAAPDEQVLIDTAGVNPYAPQDMAELACLIRSLPVEPILVMPAGGDVVDTMGIAQSFLPLGVTRLLATRIDMARRLGGLLAAADAAGFALAEYGMTPSVAGGLASFEPFSLAKMLMPHTFSAEPAQAATRGFCP